MLHTGPKGRYLVLAAALLAATACSRPEGSVDSQSVGVSAGEFIVEPATLENLGFEWLIEGDANRNSAVQIAYRQKGASEWKDGLPLLRLQREDLTSVGFLGAYTGVAPNMFAGSIFDLQPDTLYEVRATLEDPDGVVGEAVRTVEVRTRAEPKPAEGGKVYHVYPFDYQGPMEQPAFKGLLSAYYVNSVGGDWYSAFPPRVQPGDVILVHAGVYKDMRFRYGHELRSGYTECCNTTGDGTYYLTASGTADKPIVIKAAGDGEVIFDGDGNHNLFNVMGANHNYFEGITFRNTFIAFLAGVKNIAGAQGLTLKNNKFEDIGMGVHSDYSGSRDFYIADNYFTGRNDRNTVISWVAGRDTIWDAAVANSVELSNNLSQYAVKLYGSGHVVAYNSVYHFHDGIDHATYGDPDGWPNTSRDRLPVSIDIYNNDIFNVHDNCIEVDGASYNVRVMRNRCSNSAAQAYSMQPLMGGPAYFIRNVAYNSPVSGAVKFSNRPAGGVFYHNTFLTNADPGTTATGSNMHYRNNIVVRQNRERPVFGMPTHTNYSSSDYNAYISSSPERNFEWTSPDFAVASAYEQIPAEAYNQMPPIVYRVDPKDSPLIVRRYDSLEQFSAETGQDKNSFMAGLDIFQKVSLPPEGASITRVYSLDAVDYRLREGAAVIDRAVRLPNVNDGYEGNAPDMGAIEYGTAVHHYGPRVR